MIRAPRNGARCPYRPNHVYVIQTRASLRKYATVGQITVLSASEAIFEDKPVWQIRFKKGDHTDKPRLLNARPGHEEGDYTEVPSRAMKETGEEVSSQVQAKYAT